MGKEKMVTVIIPAFNEADTIAQCVAEAIRHPYVGEVIVVDDGSSDATAERAAGSGALVIRLAFNGGKAEALDVGVRAAAHDTLLFLDADVTGHTECSLSRIIHPVLDGRYEMYVGIRARSTLLLNRLLRLFPIISGERSLTRRLWDSVPIAHRNGFQIEIAMNYTAKQFERGMGFELIGGTSHRTKEQKYGLVIGLGRRLGMIADVISISFHLYILDGLARIGGNVRRRVRQLVDST
jgi:polyprenyl-phospho-N-acetylgalactosaminyl synthase